MKLSIELDLNGADMNTPEALQQVLIQLASKRMDPTKPGYGFVRSINGHIVGQLEISETDFSNEIPRKVN